MKRLINSFKSFRGGRQHGKKRTVSGKIQNVPEFELVVNSFRATHNIRIFITGSNSKLLSGELATHLSGRTLSFRIMPFCFKEYVAHCEEAGIIKSPEQLLDTYMLWGGFPLVCKETEERSKEIILSNIYDSVVLKDVVMRNKITSVTALEKVLEYSHIIETICYNELIARGYQVYAGKTYASGYQLDKCGEKLITSPHAQFFLSNHDIILLSWFYLYASVLHSFSQPIFSFIVR